MNIHILGHFPGSSAGKTKDVQDYIAKQHIKDGLAIEAVPGSEHPEPLPIEEQKENAEGDARKTKEDKVGIKRLSK